METRYMAKKNRTRWAEHFKEPLNRPAPLVPPDIPPPTELLDINNNQPSRAEIAKAIKSLKSGKAAELHQKNTKEFDKFVYLDSVVSKDRVTDEDIRCRINKARYAFNTLRLIWISTVLSVRNNVKSVLLCGSETWRVTKTNNHKLQSVTNRCLRNMLNVRWPEVIQNKELWDRTKQTPMKTKIRKRKKGWIGHTVRKLYPRSQGKPCSGTPQGKHKVGRPKQTWQGSTNVEIKGAGSTWAELKRTSPNRFWWRGFAAALCSTVNEEA
ncbi:hypothetical protein EGW08_005530 [Elysia chlorotica]|uniref:Uncharacterized protein n=1 Tax=Elysia chlorotica TaxID=188477 RepID=A0A3S0ZVB1_ELYCH|nr:hypothetical protein EGW08_005530 [Elysia chlorotica]